MGGAEGPLSLALCELGDMRQEKVLLTELNYKHVSTVW